MALRLGTRGQIRRSKLCLKTVFPLTFVQYVIFIDIDTQVRKFRHKLLVCKLDHNYLQLTAQNSLFYTNVSREILWCAVDFLTRSLLAKITPVKLRMWFRNVHGYESPEGSCEIRNSPCEFRDTKCEIRDTASLANHVHAHYDVPKTKYGGCCGLDVTGLRLIRRSISSSSSSQYCAGHRLAPHNRTLGDLEWEVESTTVTHSSADWWDHLLPLA